MFFSLEHTSNNQFSQHWQLGQLTLNTDQGWQQLIFESRVLIFKGYTDCAPLATVVLNCLDHELPGNFCVFDYNTTTGNIVMRTNQWRGFLAWYNQHQRFSNLVSADKCLWNDGSVSIDQTLHIVEDTLDIIGSIPNNTIDRVTAVNSIHKILTEKTQQFVQHNNLPLRVFCSGGIDTALVYSYVKTATDNYELILGNHNEWDKFWCKNSRLLSESFWAYRNIHHWRDPCVVTSGAWGDECMLKNPNNANIWLMYHGIDIYELLDSNEYRDCTHYKFFNSDKSRQLYHAQQCDPAVIKALDLSPTDFYKYYCNIVINDCQHWHIGNTLTFTPLRDFDILKIMLRMDPKDVILQMFNGDISRQLIAFNDATILPTLSHLKDSGEELENLSSLIKSHT